MSVDWVAGWCGIRTQRVQFAEKAQITTLSATQGSILAQPQRWVF
ncbi:hypothetical protein PSTAB_1321 [Stutzerimonas stutzeri]|uniref:Uncharacterized protein n=1 Tax=Stutzerimonas stutzeri (strain ATCC 17588 / DSM 5190 / CCUG 11256 / JCM 5965 / LMG 11199 / NBRC 14165 / NCIMB 11358 / Stanier 221) TaxID=96563 RepID=F8H3I7_STUS2|nr:hypothetical protein PSTAB_1321 [Stutzerimonas stutzeri]